MTEADRACFRLFQALGRHEYVLRALVAANRRRDGWTLPRRELKLRQVGSEVEIVMSDLSETTAMLIEILKGLHD